MTGTITQPTYQDSIEIAAPPAEVWRMVAEVTRMGEWSPVCHTVEWIGEPAAPAAGARFRGKNRVNGVRWSRECVITEADPGRVCAFSTVFRGQEQTRWRYRFELAGDRTRVAEEYQIVSIPLWLRALRAVPGVKAKSERDTRWNIGETLARLKAAAERSPT